MTLHTSQHLLSAVLEGRLLRSIQDEANTLVFEGRRVRIEVEELHANNVPGVARLENGRTAGKALPSDYTGGVKRTVIIDGVDRNP